MAFEPFMQIMRGLQGRRSGDGLGQIQNFQQMAYLRDLSKEIERVDDLNMPLQSLNVVVFDIETTGFSPEKGDTIISIGAVKLSGATDMKYEEFYSLANSEKEVPPEIVALTGITNEEVQQAKPLKDVLIDFFRFTQDCTLVAHHANHERQFMSHVMSKLFRITFKHRIVDTAFLYKIVEPNLQLVTLEDLCQHNQIPIVDRHHALGDAKMTAELWRIYVEKAKQIGCGTLQDVYDRFSRM